MRELKRNFLTATDGEIFYTENGGIKRIENLQAFNEMVAEEKRIATTYFTVTIGGIKYSYQMYNFKVIMNLLKRIPNLDTRIQEQARYIKEKEEANL